MPTIKIDTKLVKFLKEEDVWDIFVMNVKRGFPDDFESTATIFTIGEAFVWPNATSREPNWHVLNERYKKYCNIKKV